MSLPPFKTLGEVRDEVLVRVGAASAGNKGTRWHAKIESLIRSAVNQLFAEGDWVAVQVTTDIATTADNAYIDWPDNAQPGAIHSLIAISTSGEETPVEPGARSQERNTGHRDSASGRPICYDFTGEMIELIPPPSATWPTIRVRYTAAPNAMMAEEDPIVVDAEAVTMQVVMAFKRDQGLPTSQDDRAEFERYLLRIRARQSTADGFVIGGHRSAKQNVHLRNRVARGQAYGKDAPYTEGWSPF